MFARGTVGDGACDDGGGVVGWRGSHDGDGGGSCPSHHLLGHVWILLYHPENGIESVIGGDVDVDGDGWSFPDP